MQTRSVSSISVHQSLDLVAVAFLAVRFQRLGVVVKLQNLIVGHDAARRIAGWAVKAAAHWAVPNPRPLALILDLKLLTPNGLRARPTCQGDTARQ